MPSPTPTPDPARRSDRARTAILAAARDRLAEVGYDRLTVEGIAASAGVGKQTIYRWWPSKGAVVFDALLDLHTAQGAAPALPDTGAIDADLRTVMRAVVAELTEPAADAMQRTVAAEIQRDPALASELVTRLLRPQMEAVAARLRAAQDDGQVGPQVDIAVAVEAFLGPVFHRWLLRTAPLDAAYADRVVDQALGGLAPRP